MYHKNFTLQQWILILCTTFSSQFLIAQNGPGFTANDQVIPNNGYFEYGTNLGYYFGWADYQLGDLAIGNPITNTEGIGATALRPGLFEHYLEEFGYNVNIPAYVHYDNLGLKNHTLFVGYASDEHRDTSFNCPTHFDQTRVFKNLYAPIWDDGTDGTPVNDTNYYALFLYKMVNLYGPYIQYWEIWNEPDLDFNPNGIGWRPPGDPAGSWWDADPELCDMQWGAPIEYYNRLLRISWEVIKTYDPDSYICVGGLGFPSFLDAMMRNTDNPVDGSVTPDYPLLGGAYFDVLSFHSYPHINGSLQTYDPVSNQVVQKRNTDTAVRGIVEDLNDFKSVLVNYGYDGVTFPEKETIMTESSLPRLKLFDYIGSEAAASNYLIKLPIYLQKENVRQFHVYDLGEKKDSADAVYPFDVTGLYENPVGKDFTTIKRTNQGFAYKTVSNILYEKTYDATQTVAMNLPVDVDGAAFLDANGEYTYVLWAITQLDDSEVANAVYSFPTGFGINTMEKKEWDYSRTGQTTFTGAYNIALTGAPIFLQESTVQLAITCPQNITAETDPITNDVQVNWFPPTISSLCDSASVVISQTAGPSNGSLFTVGTTTISYEATDTCGNTEVCSFDVIVTDPPPPPPLNCPTGEHKFTLNVIGNGSIDVEFKDPAAATVNYPTGTHVECMVDDQLLKLIPVPGQGETFDGWTSGGCTGTGVCWKGISWTTEITAVFTSVNASTAPTISATTTDVSCFLGNDGSIAITASNGTPGYTYLWNTGDTTANLNNVIAGTYTITVTDAAGETATSSNIISQPSNLIGLIAAKNDLDCATVHDGFVSATAVGGTAPYSFSWSNGETTATITDLPTGTYTVTVSDANNCQTTIEEILTAGTLNSPMANFSKLSNGLAVDFTDMSTGMPTSWNWDFGDGNISNIASPSHTYSSAGTFTVCLIVENDCGLNAFCQDVTTIAISTTTTDVLCFGDSTGSIVINPIAGQVFSYLWNTGDTTTMLNNLVAGTYSATVTNATGETANITAVINEPIALVGSIASQTDVNCFGGADGSATASASGGTSPYTYAWSDGSSTASISGLMAGDYTVTVTDANGCTSSTIASILDGDNFSPFADFNPIVSGLSVLLDDLSVGPPTAWSWDFDDGNTSTVASPTHTFATNGTYNVCLIASNICGADTLCQMVTTLDVTLQPIDVLCNGENTGSISTITVTGQNYTYLWNTGATTADLNNLIAGTYTVTISNAQGDTLSTSTTVNEPSALAINIISQTDATCFQGDDGTITIEGIGGVGPYTYDWTGGRSGAAISDLTQGIYTVTVTDANDCEITESIFVDMGTTQSPSAFFSNSAVGLTLDFIDLSTGVPTNWQWDFGDGNTSNITSPTHTYDTIGMYNVCLIVDNICGQDTLCQNISVGLDNNVFMSLGSVSGNLGDTVHIPFFVEGFENVLTFQHSVSIDDTTIATFVGISDFDTSLVNNNPAISNVNPDFVSVSWVNNNGVLTLPDSTPLYYLDVLIKGQPNECVDIVIDGAVTPIEFIMLDSTGIVIGSYGTSLGEACSSPGMLIDGLIVREDGMEIENVDIHVNGNLTTTTDASGIYNLPPYPSGQTVVIEPHKDINHVNGVTSYDLAVMQQHIVGTYPITSPYKLIAADVNNNGDITSFDLFLAQQVIVGNSNSFPNNESWRFVPFSHVFLDPTDPWAGGIPESITVTGTTGNVSLQDFIAIKVADVTDSATPNLQSGDNGSEARTSTESLEFLMDKKINTVEGNGFIEFTAKDFNQLSSFELDLLFEKNKIQFEKIESDYLNMIYGVSLLEEGILSLVWFDKTGNRDGLSLNDETVLFRIYFSGLTAINDSPLELLQISRTKKVSNAYTFDGSPREIQLTSLSTENSENHLASELIVSPNQPNPFTDETRIAFHLPTDEQTQIDVFDTNGKLVYHLEQFFQKGKNVLTIDSKHLPHYGIYYVRINTNTQQGISKIVFVK